MKGWEAVFLDREGFKFKNKSKLWSNKNKMQSYDIEIRYIFFLKGEERGSCIFKEEIMKKLP